MRTIFTILFISSISINTLLAQKCHVDEDFEPLSDSLTWVIGKKYQNRIFIGKSDTNQLVFCLDLMILSPYATTIEDSIRIEFENNHVLRVKNGKNVPPQKESFNLLYTTVDFDYLSFIIPVNRQDLASLAHSKIKKIYMKVYSKNTLPQREKFLKRMRAMYRKKATNGRIADNYVEITLNRILKKARKEITRNAICAENYAH